MTEKPVLLYDGECLFCRLWVGQWQRHDPLRASYIPFQVGRSQFPHIPEEQFKRSVHLIGTGIGVRHGADAVLQLLSAGSRLGKVFHWLYRRLPGFAWISEQCYSVVAAHRSVFLHLTRFFFGERVGPPAAASAMA